MVLEPLPNTNFKVQIGDKEIRCYLAGRINRNRIRISPGDKVEVVLSDDGELGRITWRL